MTKKRIVYVEANVDGTIGGSYYSLLYLLEGLNKEKYQPIVIFAEKNELIPKYEAVAESVIIFNTKTSASRPISKLTDIVRYFPRFFKHVIIKQKKLIKFIREMKPDLIHLNNGYDVNHEWILACYLSGVKVITHDRGTRPPASLQTKMFVKLLDYIICVSDAYLGNVYDQRLKPKNACRVYNGLDIKQFTKGISENYKMELKKQIGIYENTILIGMIGNIDYWKGQRVFIQAVHAIIEQEYDVNAILVGPVAKGAEEYYRELIDYINSGLSRIS